MRPKSLALLLLALGCGLVASIGITRVMTTWTDKPDMVAGGTEPVVVATADVGMGEMLSAKQIKLENWPKGKIPAGTVSVVADVEGRRTRTRLYSGEPILEGKLFAKGVSQQGAAAMITSGLRVVTVKVDLVSGGGSLILPGDHVDVMVHLVRDANKGINETVTRTILQNVKVFAVNDVLGVEKEGDGKSIAAKTISLLVTPEQAAKIMLATEMGTINLVMRSPEDDQRVADAQARPAELFGAAVRSDREPEISSGSRAAKTVPAPTAPQTTEASRPRTIWTMRVIKANELGEVKFERDAQNASAPFEMLKTKPPKPGTTQGEPKGEGASAVENAPSDEPRNPEPASKQSDGDGPI